MSDLDEHEITFEDLGLSRKTFELDNIKKVINLNLKIKRPAKRKDFYKGGTNSNIPSTSKNSYELPPDVKPEIIPKLCNGESCPTTDQILSAIEELRDLVKQNCNETHDIRKDLLGIKGAMLDDNSCYVPFMKGPCQTLDDLNLLDYRVQEDETSKLALEKLLSKIDDDTVEKYVSGCLKAIISDKVAAQCKWLANKTSPSTSVNDMVIMRVICDCTRQKFPTASTSLVSKLMKKWLKCAKERWRRSIEAKKLNSDAKEVLHHLK